MSHSSQIKLQSQSETFLPSLHHVTKASLGDPGLFNPISVDTHNHRGTRRGVVGRLGVSSPIFARDVSSHRDLGSSSSAYMLKASSSAILGPSVSSRRSSASREHLDQTLVHDLQLVAKRIVIEKKLGCAVLVLGCSNSDSYPMDRPDPLGSPTQFAQGVFNPLALGIPEDTAMSSSRVNSRSGSRPGSRSASFVENAELLAQEDQAVLGSTEKAWFQCCMSQSIREMEKILEDYADMMDRRDYFNGNTALHWAAKFNNRDMLGLCLRMRANLNQKSHGGDTALHVAARMNHPDVCVALLNSGADINVRNHKGQLAFHVAHKCMPDQVKERLVSRTCNSGREKESNNLVKKSSTGRVYSRSTEDSTASLSGSRPNSKSNTPHWFKRKSSHPGPQPSLY